ncbi:MULTISPECIES: 3-oxoacyl-ACP synthase III family protein [unclassified Streptomyces]|jgi:3-oxoacyl-[acyl-carrier-protein] synthase-3|uniref:3-oxoacyl-ACP synthase III family protein n=1 Tax=unclassified Streptomyces TaxID=2593676 RepID=UPI00224E79D9|nr:MULTISPECIES: beta-ketoacyl-ACP synthase III [unclassified Streptomyces]MCX4409534.1 ketoacyl-ACP synthase III [Streptomyces sp. NBC_01764]MCX5191304.1 ketoacyl-ACP synthase III [Streptomyces sp. NBC_00268]
MNIGILATGSYLPETVVTNDDLAARVDTSDAWVTSRTGIRERRLADPGHASSDLGRLAALAALADGNLSVDQIDALVVATSSPDRIQPSTACHVHAKLGMTEAPAFDVNAVCSGFVYAAVTAAGLMTSFPRYRRALVVGCETYSRILDYDDRTTCVFFGDGAGAAVLGPVPDGFGILGCELLTDSSRLETVSVPAGGSAEPARHDTVRDRRHFFRMDGRGVWEFAADALPRAVKGALASAGLDTSDVDVLITHQANARLIEACADSLGVPRERVPTTVDRYGNTAAASVPITLHHALAQRRIRRGDIVVLAAVGGGMTAGAMVLRWY